MFNKTHLLPRLAEACAQRKRNSRPEKVPAQHQESWATGTYVCTCTYGCEHIMGSLQYIRTCVQTLVGTYPFVHNGGIISTVYLLYLVQVGKHILGCL